MSTWQALPAATLGDAALSLAQFLAHSRRRGLLLQHVRDAIVEQYLLQTADQLGLTASTADLQQAAERFRYRHGLTVAADMHAWIAARHLPLADFEDALERDLIIDRLRDHLTRDHIDTHFANHRAEYDRVRLRQIIIARDDLAEELSQQIRDDGADFLTLAHQHGGCRPEVLRRRQLPIGHAEAVFATAASKVIGPLSSPGGFHLYHVEEILPAELDAATRRLIREQLFAAWLQHKVDSVPMTFPLLDLL